MIAARPIVLATRGSPLALAQTHLVLAQCRARFPAQAFEIKVIKTTGDKLQTASLSKTDPSLPKGLFTKELEVALLNGEADLAIHSLKDLPTELPDGLALGATPPRADVRDVMIYRASSAAAEPTAAAPTDLAFLHLGATVASSSTRRRAQLSLTRPDLNLAEIRGNVATRLGKVAKAEGPDATILALAGLERLNFRITPEGRLLGDSVPDGLRATFLDLAVMLPCVGQGAIGIEIRSGDAELEKLCAGLNDAPTFHAVTAERAFLRGLGGGCQSPVAAYAEVLDQRVAMRVISFQSDPVRRAEGQRPLTEAAALGEALAAQLR